MEVANGSGKLDRREQIKRLDDFVCLCRGEKKRDETGRDGTGL